MDEPSNQPTPNLEQLREQLAPAGPPGGVMAVGSDNTPIINHPAPVHDIQPTNEPKMAPPIGGGVHSRGVDYDMEEKIQQRLSANQQAKAPVSVSQAVTAVNDFYDPGCYTDEEVVKITGMIERSWIAASIMGAFTVKSPLGAPGSWKVDLTWDQIVDIATGFGKDPAFIRKISRGLDRLCPHALHMPAWTNGIVAMYALLEYMRMSHTDS